MKNKKPFILIAVLLVVTIIAGANVLFFPKGWPLVQTSPVSNIKSAPPLDTNNSVPIGLIGTVTALGTSTVTIQGQPQGNTSPVTLTVSVDAKTSITKVGPAPVYATSTAKFTDFTKGMLLNVAATAAQSGVRHAERIVIPPPAAQ